MAIASSLALVAGAEALFQPLQIPFWHAASAMFCTLSCQMLWATVAHVANDWPAVPLSVWLLLLLIWYYDSPGRGPAGIAAGVLGAALLTKAYFLVTVPLLPHYAPGADDGSISWWLRLCITTLLDLGMRAIYEIIMTSQGRWRRSQSDCTKLSGRPRLCPG